MLVWSGGRDYACRGAGWSFSVAAGTAIVPIGRAYRFDQIVQAHADMEANGVSGKLVVLT